MADKTAREQSRALVRWIWRGYLRPHTAMILLALLLMGIEGSMLGAISYLVKPMFENIVGGNRGAIPLVAIAIFAVFAAKSLSGFFQRVLMTRVGQRVAAALQRDLVAHMLTLDSLWFQKTPPGNLIERVRGDTQAAATIWSTVLAATGRDAVALISLMGVALSVDVRWTLIAMTAVPLVVLPVMSLQRWVRRSARAARHAAASIATRLDEIFHGVTTIKLNRLETRESDRFAETVEGFVHQEIRSAAGQAGIPALIDIVAGIGLMAVIGYGGLQIIDGEKTLGEFMSFFTAMALVFEPLRRLGNVTGAWQAALASLERLHDVFQSRPTILSPPQPRKLPVAPDKAEIVLDDVSLAYDDMPVLTGLTLRAEPGRMTALVGPSGAGKSTVFNILTRLVEPQSGRVEIGGLPIAEMTLPDLRNLFSVVTQDSSLFDESLRDNILLGRSDVSPARLDEVLEAAHITDFLPNLAQGLDSPAGPRGSNLSGGQRQRVAIARALLRDAPILLLDEATSALDAKSERVVQQALDRLSRTRTTLVIAHRLTTVRAADRIVVMDRGRAVEQGSHEALIARGGLYSGLYKMQFAAES